MKQLLQTIHDHYAPNVEPDYVYHDITIRARLTKMGVMVSTIAYYLANEEQQTLEEALVEVEDYLIHKGEKGRITSQETEWLKQITTELDKM
jgi:uncharacterized protein (UPF0216 family)